jgi:RNA polymerase sigma-70 factor (ECF subfamily)
LVEEVRGGGEGAERALEELCGIYWFPVYAYARWGGASPEDAEDLTQGFFARLLERRDLEAADSGKGRLRSYLLGSLKNFSVSEHRKRNALKRGGGVVTVPIDVGVAEERLAAEPVDGTDPAQLFEQQWAANLLDQAFARLESDYARSGKGKLYELLSPYLAGRQTKGDRYAAAGEELGMSAGAVQVAIHRMRKRYRDHLGEVVGETLEDPAELEDEMRHILRVVAGKNPAY